MVLLLFVASIAATGLMHQAGWLAGTKSWTENKRWSDIHDSIKIQEIGGAIRDFAKTHNGNTPISLFELVPNYLARNERLYSSLPADEPPEIFIYFSGPQTNPHQVLLAAPKSNGKQRWILTRDWSEGRIDEADFQKLLQE
ncbi:MAG: hypothetical protein V4710_00275 [Verrucomicrobiota bacterium]